MKTNDTSSMRYVKKVNINPEMAHNKILGRIKEKSTVLEVGPASGAMTKVLKEELNCKVYIIEIDEDCFKKALQYSEDGFCGNIEEEGWKTRFSDLRFDYIIFCDVLEHLYNPIQVLKTMEDYLKDDGSIMLSVPNCAHNSILIQLYNNQIFYQDTGILDYTHVHYFTFNEVKRVCEEANYEIVYLDGTYIAVGKNEFDIDYCDIDPRIAELLQHRNLGELYQYIVEIKRKDYVLENNQVLDNCLGEPIEYIDDISVSEDRLLKQVVADPGAFFSTNNEIARLRLEINDLYNLLGKDVDKKRLFDIVTDCRKEIREKNNHIRIVQKEISDKSGEVNELKKELKKTREDFSEMKMQVSVLEVDKKIKNELYEKIENQERELRELTKSNAELAVKNTELSTKNTELSTKNTELSTKNTELTTKNTELNDANKDLINQNENLEGLCSEYKKNNDELIARIESVENQNRRYVSEVDQMHSSEAELQQSILNKQGHIELLLEKEREYEREKNSRTYRLANKFRKISLFFFPVNSKRRFFAHLFVHALRHPILTLKMINGRRIKNCFIILKKEGVSSAIHHFNCVEEYVKQGTISTEKLDVVEVKSEPDKKFEEYEHISFTKFKNPRVSIVIPVYNQFDYTYNCLASILRNSGDCTYEIIIANDCSTDYTTRLSELVDNINVVTNKTNLRFLRNCNNAAKQAKGEFILFLNNDTQVQPDWLKPLFDLMDKDSKVGMVGSKLIYADGSLQEAGGILWDDGSAWNYGNRKNPEESDFSYVKEADYISGAAIMIRKSLWKEIGGFDDRFAPAYCEDSDLAFEVRKHGYKVMLQPLSLVVHFEGISNGTDVNAGQKKYQIDNQQKFLEKWGEELKKNHFPNGTNVYVARDRSKDKKHILVIDHYVPQYDKDAGSKTTFMYLKMFVQKGYHVTFLGDNFYRHEPYTTELQQMGIMVLYGPYYAQNWESWLSENIDVFDIFYLNRPHISVKYIDFIKERAKGKIIYYGHDLHFLRNRREYELTGDEAKLKESEEWKEKELYLMKRADMNYYPSATEEVAIHEIDKRIPVKAITAYVYENFPKVSFDGKKREGLLFVGGFGHDPNLDAVKWFLDRIFPKVYERIQAPFYIVGSKAPKELTELKEPGVIVKGFVSEEELTELYSNCRMCVVPLRYGAGVKGKVVEAIYNAIPIVTTSVGAEGIVGIEEFTEVKDTEEELIDAICDTYTDEKKLKSMSEMSQKYIKEHFSTDAVWSVIEEDFK